MAEEKQDVETLKRRGRRRLVGAVALVLAAVIVLPMVFDQEPPGKSGVSVRIPDENETPFKPKAPEKKKEAPKPVAEAPKPEAPKPVTPKPAAPQEEFVVQVGAFSNPKGAVAKLQSAKIPYYTEPMQGNLTRVRAGPFATREAAEKALERLKGLGFQPGSVSARSG